MEYSHGLTEKKLIYSSSNNKNFQIRFFNVKKKQLIIFHFFGKKIDEYLIITKHPILRSYKIKFNNQYVSTPDQYFNKNYIYQKINNAINKINTFQIKIIILILLTL